MTTRADVVRVAREWMNPPTRWQHQAMLKGVATDCIGLIAGVAYELGIVDARPEVRPQEFNGYSPSPDPRLLKRACDAYLDEIAITSANIGDILLMRFDVEPQHFAIITQIEPMYIVHAYRQARKVTEHRVDEIWAARIVRAYRFRGIA